MTKGFEDRWEELRAAGDSPAQMIELLRDFVRDFPDFGPGWRWLGLSLYDVSQFEDAERALRRSLELASAEWLHFALADLGNLFRLRGDAAAAETWFRKAIAHAPSHASAYTFLGAMLARLGRLAEAEQLHRQGTACDGGAVDEAYHNLGLVLRSQGRYEEAVECFELALGIDPEYGDARSASQDVVRAMEVRRRRR
jgi:tetratricopeptide (TPR) repeat protein